MKRALKPILVDHLSQPGYSDDTVEFSLAGEDTSVGYAGENVLLASRC